MPLEIAVIGTGYVGLVTGVCLAYLGHSVTCIDSDAGKIATLSAGQVPIFEPGVEPLLRQGLICRRLRFSTEITDIARARVVFIAVGTPPREDGSPDLSDVQSVARAIGRVFVESGDDGLRVVVNKSTVPVGSGNWVEMLVIEGGRSAVNGNGGGPQRTSELGDEAARRDRFLVASNPEFLREGSAIHDTLYPDRIVIGAADERAVAMLRAVYEPILSQQFRPPAGIAERPEGFGGVPLIVTDLASAEMVKYAANAFLATKISFANEVANICECVGADVVEVMRGIGLDDRIGMRFLNAGIGWGGSCFGKDLAALTGIAREYAYEPELLQSTIGVNTRQRQTVIRKLQQGLKLIKGRTIGLLGLAFKPLTDDLRDAPSIDIARALLAMGARVKVHDPVANEPCYRQFPELDVVYAADVDELVTDCDAIVLVTEWEQFLGLDFDRVARLMVGKVVIDGRNALDRDAVRAAGLNYWGVGR
jgi:UDPglucose 6-dehydrogenase